ncbi:MAG TPA: ribosome biogenesis GTPase Der [Pyrinomonadaceae bacterium]|nr:ribosome biogenesis GTPase Der [Chloracidobacterium sp.]MBP9936097.1 ribosome biogenesis GTPase Der [Pyrinomonadaceae bacterium]MBK7803634.1 ribosome biogenesis GTPase Der [Chloracidobacterium sp.]MBK9439678.1 ribosome biogenesis GTPase Der [Chloracidobacterium sp.]MBL0239035.1 ribosome biogenesis GTPase Der [Chloracidobacterium sp.]
MKAPLVAIIGRPNVGKSTLFNRLTGSRKAIVGDEPGITRDRMFGEVEWKAQMFRLVDTGGIVPDDDAIIPANIFKQASHAIEESVAIIWVLDTRAGITPLDEELGVLLRNTGKPIIIAANKVESRTVENEAGEFYQFGFEMSPISAEHGTGVGDLLDLVFDHLVFEDENDEAEKPREIRLAIIGRPNVGKSSLLNKLLGEERVIVSPIAGTTRDAIDTYLTADGKDYMIIDTAGIRRKGKTTEMAEKLSVIMARKALERADVAIIVIDAVEGVTNLDANIAGYAVDSGCSVIIVVNKWDALEEKETNTIYEFERTLRMAMKFLDWAPIVTISALTGQRVTKILPLVAQAHAARNLRIQTSRLNRFFEDSISQPKGGTAPAPVKGGFSRLKVQFLTQAGIRPPLFILFTSGGNKAGLHFSYLRYIENQLRSEFDFFGTPVRLVERHKMREKK